MPIDHESRDFVQSLERGLAVLRAFDATHSHMTLREVAEATELSRPATRRLLLTLEALGYVASDGPTFTLTARVVSLALGFTSSRSLTNVSQRHLAELSDTLDESTSLTVLDGNEVVYLVRIPTQRILSLPLAVGARLPAHASAPGRVLLAHVEPDVLDRYLEEVPLERYTSRTIVEPRTLRAVLAETAQSGWTVMDQELEDGLRSVGAPVRDASEKVVGAIGCSCITERVPYERLRRQVLPRLVETANAISRELGSRSRTERPEQL